MANGDAAAAAGMDIVLETDDRRMGYDEINKTRDYIAEQALRWVQLDGVDSEVRTITQHGIGKIAGVAAGSITEAVSFPRPFASIPVTHVDYIGGKATPAAFDPAGLIDIAPPTFGKGISPSTSGLTVIIRRADGANMSVGYDYYYSVTATGVPA